MFVARACCTKAWFFSKDGSTELDSLQLMWLLRAASQWSMRIISAACFPISSHGFYNLPQYPRSKHKPRTTQGGPEEDTHVRYVATYGHNYSSITVNLFLCLIYIKPHHTHTQERTWYEAWHVSTSWSPKHPLRLLDISPGTREIIVYCWIFLLPQKRLLLPRGTEVWHK